MPNIRTRSKKTEIEGHFEDVKFTVKVEKVFNNDGRFSYCHDIFAKYSGKDGLQDQHSNMVRQNLKVSNISGAPVPSFTTDIYARTHVIAREITEQFGRLRHQMDAQQITQTDALDTLLSIAPSELNTSDLQFPLSLSEVEKSALCAAFDACNSRVDVASAYEAIERKRKERHEINLKNRIAWLRNLPDGAIIHSDVNAYSGGLLWRVKRSKRKTKCLVVVRRLVEIDVDPRTYKTRWCIKPHDALRLFPATNGRLQKLFDGPREEPFSAHEKVKLAQGVRLSGQNWTEPLAAS